MRTVARNRMRWWPGIGCAGPSHGGGHGDIAEAATWDATLALPRRCKQCRTRPMALTRRPPPPCMGRGWGHPARVRVLRLGRPRPHFGRVGARHKSLPSRRSQRGGRRGAGRILGLEHVRAGRGGGGLQLHPLAGRVAQTLKIGLGEVWRLEVAAAIVRLDLGPSPSAAHVAGNVGPVAKAVELHRLEQLELITR
eukprot:scaffold20916_cov97-Isochrysis_galbana.AAC.3